MPCINFLTEILPGPALAVFAFQPMASNSHNAVGLKSRRNTKQLMLLQLSINLKTPRKCGVLNFYGEGVRRTPVGVVAFIVAVSNTPTGR